MSRKVEFLALVLFAVFSFSFAAECPPGAEDCFLCGNTPCTTDCQGAWDEASQRYVSCSCPQGEECTCFCPYIAEEDPAESGTGACPAGATDCFLCGGVGGIPCYSGPACEGVWSVSAHQNIACECPQGEPCTCYCPYSQYGLLDLDFADGPAPCPPECTYGCSADGTICAKLDALDIEASSNTGGLSSIQGEVFIRKAGSDWARVTGPIHLDEDYDVLVMDGSAVLWLEDGTHVSIEEDTLFTVHQFIFLSDKSTIETVFELVHGAITSDVTARDGTKFEVETKVSVAGVKGTSFYIAHDEATNTDTIKVYEGEVEVESSSGTLALSEGQMVRVTASGTGAPTYFEGEPEEAPSPEVSVESEGCCAPSFALLLLALGAMSVSRN